MSGAFVAVETEAEEVAVDAPGAIRCAAADPMLNAETATIVTTTTSATFHVIMAHVV